MNCARCLVYMPSSRLGVYSHTPPPRTFIWKGSGDVGADSWFCKLSKHVIICIGLSTCGHVMMRKIKKKLQCPHILAFALEGGIWE